jgi:adenylate kinase family enzyme
VTERILIIGLPGAEKTTLASALKQYAEKWAAIVGIYILDRLLKLN